MADLGGGDGGDASPPTSLKVTILAEKSASILNNSAPFRDASPPTDLNVTNPAAKAVSILVKTFFFFFLSFWRPPDFGRKKRLKSRFRPKNHSQLWWRHPNFWGFGFKSPPPKFSGSATECPPPHFRIWCPFTSFALATALVGVTMYCTIFQ